MKLSSRMHHWFLNDLFATPRGRAYVLSQAADAESCGERKIFGVLLERVNDPELSKMVKKHREDEARHAKMYSECAARQGARLPPIPDELRVIDTVDEYIGRARGGVRFFDETVHDDRYVLEGYLFLQVLEERAVQEFGILADALRSFDPRSAAIVNEIAADERRHLRYCHAISKRYAANPQQLESTLASFRRAETLAHLEHTKRSLDFLLREGFIASQTKTFFWRGVMSATALGELPWTDVGRPTVTNRDTSHAASAA